MFTIRFERRDVTGRLTVVMEKDFRYIYNTVVTRWLKQELLEALYAKDTVTIKNVTEDTNV